MLGQRFETNRVKLSDHIPMDTPFSVTMVPSSRCNFACTFCPSREMAHKAAIMPFWKAKMIMDNAGFPQQVKMLSLYNVGEPLLNPALPNIIRYAKIIKFTQRASIVTNASLLTREWSERLIDSGIDRIIISIYGLSDADYYRNTNRYINFEGIYQNIRYLNEIKGNCQVLVKIIDRAVSEPWQKATFIEMFKDHCTSYSFEPILPIWPNFRPEPYNPALKDVGLYAGIPAVDRLACHYPFYSMVVNARGFVNPCLANWNESMVLGNANLDSLKSIWNSASYQTFRLVQLSGKRRNHFLCSTCGTLRTATCPEDDIDGTRLMLLEKMFPEVYKSHEEKP